jgi:DNA-binding GntR family transcriptional regulator
MVDADLRFHEALVEAARSKRLSRMFRTLIAETRLSMAMGLEYPEWSHPAAEHQTIIDSLKRGRKAEMLKRLDEHLVHNKSGKR